MHDQLSEILGEEVVGEVTQIGDTFFDVGLGRICLERLDRERIALLLARVREAFGDGVTITDRLYLSDASQTTRGVVEASIRDPDIGNLYLLQITSDSLATFYERRFMLQPKVVADLAGTFSKGLFALVATGTEGPLRVLSGYDRLTQLYLERLDTVVQASVNGGAIDVGPLVEELVEPMRAAWKLIPWPLRSKLQPVARTGSERVTRHDRVLRRTVLFATNVINGDRVYEYTHQHNELEEYDQVLGWMTEIHTAMIETYPPPEHATAMARASSIEKFMEFFPGYQTIVGPELPEGEAEG